MPLQIPTGNFAFALNIVLPASASVIPVYGQNSKRMERDFRLVNVQSYQTGNFSIIFGSQFYEWFADYCWFDTVLGNAVLPHFLPAEGKIIEKGDFIIAKTRNETEAINQITLLFQGEYL